MPTGYGAAATGVPVLDGEPGPDDVGVGEGDTNGRDACVGTAVGVEEAGEPDGMGATLADVAVRLRDGTGVAGRPVTGLTAGIGV